MLEGKTGHTIKRPVLTYRQNSNDSENARIRIEPALYPAGPDPFLAEYDGNLCHNDLEQGQHDAEFELNPIL